MTQVAGPRCVRGSCIGFIVVISALMLGVVWLGAAPRASAAGSSGEIDGNVLNGTTGGKPLTGQSVSLILNVGAGQQQVATTTTDAAGNFHFSGLATDDQDIYEASVAYQGATYMSDPISLAGDAHPPAITVLAYDATASDAQLGIGRVTLLINAPNVERGTMRVVELYTMVNAGNQTFVGQTGPSGGMPMGLLRFALPAGYSNLIAQDGFSGGQIIQVNRGFASTVPVMPGQTQFSFSFEYPYAGTHSTLTYEAVYPTVQTVVLAPPSMALQVAGGKSLGTVNAAGGPLQVWQVGPLTQGKTAAVSMSKLPVPGETPNFDPRWLDVLGALLAALAFGLVVYFLRRPLGAGMAFVAGRPKVSGSGYEGETGEMLQALARLDREHGAGEIEEAAYHVRRDQLKAELKARLLQSATPAGGVSR